MIVYLNIENLGIIDKLEVEFKEKLNILTGETGAGKTLIVESLNLLSGSRFSKEMIRRGSDYLLVEAIINLKEKIYKKILDLNKNIIINNEDINDDGSLNLTISRRVDIKGKNISKINGELVTVNELKNFMLYIIDIHGQHENQNILMNETQRFLVDKFAYNEIKDIYKEYSEKYTSYKNIIKLLENDLNDEMYTKRQIDLLNFQITEIEDAALKPGEDEEIENLFKLYSSSERIITALNLSRELLSDDVLKNLSLVSSELENISLINEKYSKYLQSIKSSFYELEEVNYDIDSEIDNISVDDNELRKIENRLDIINSLKRKYGQSIEEIFNYLNGIKIEYNRLVNFEEEKELLEKDLLKIKDELEILSQKLYEIRKKHSKQISSQITKELHDLEMKTAEFHINIIKTDDFNQYGKDYLEFQIMTNKGSGFLAIEKIASGGEMSRIMLAIKTILSKEDETPILIFDEIDTGISGITGQVAGEKLKHIAIDRQVLCVTHLPTLAAQGDNNYYIFKENEDGIVKTKINQLSEKEIINEIARISSGKLTDEAIKYAEELRSRRK